MRPPEKWVVWDFRTFYQTIVPPAALPSHLIRRWLALETTITILYSVNTLVTAAVCHRIQNATVPSATAFASSWIPWICHPPSAQRICVISSPLQTNTPSYNVSTSRKYSLQWPIWCNNLMMATSIRSNSRDVIVVLNYLWTRNSTSASVNSS